MGGHMTRINIYDRRKFFLVKYDYTFIIDIVILAIDEV